MSKTRLTDMTADELASETTEFDREFASDTFGEPDEKALQQLERAQRKRGRPVRGAGDKPISVTVENSRLTRVDPDESSSDRGAGRGG